MSIQLIKGKKHLVIKRDGRLEPFSWEKLEKVINYATQGNKYLNEVIKENLSLKIYDKIPVSKILDNLINTVANMISPMYPHLDEVAKRLLILKTYKENFNLKVISKLEYPDYLELVKRNIRLGLYDKKIFSTFTEEELRELGEYIKPERDFLFTFKGFYLFTQKYCLKVSHKSKKIEELPQHTYMRIAIYSFYKEKNRKKRLELIKQKYDDLSLHRITEASPKMINAGTPNSQLASCVLIKVSDDTYSILETSKQAGFFSKYAGGLAIDVSRIRSRGSTIKGNRGYSNGVIPFVKLYESVISAFNQGGLRKGACAIYFPWYHYEVEKLVMLKDAGGTEEERARKLQYAIKWNRIFSKRIIENKEITLFDPRSINYILDEVYGDEFEKVYNKLEQSKTYKHKKINARDLAYLIAKVRSETGNLYIFFDDNVNEQNMMNLKIYQSNLCTEVVLPNEPILLDKIQFELKQENLNVDNVNEILRNIVISESKKSGKIALCNLASIDLYQWYHSLSEKEKDNLIYNLLVSFDNMIETQYYPSKEGEIWNKMLRPIGIGVYNYAKLLASLKIKFTDEQAKEITHIVFEDLLYYVIKNSIRLAKERGKFKLFEYSKWKYGILPFDLSILRNRLKDKRKDLVFELRKEKEWNLIREDLMKYGIRFSYHLAIAPTSTSARVINATESTEPIIDLFTIDEGTYILPNLVPNIKEFREYYQSAYEIPNKTLIELASIRQQFIDQAQSITLYYKNPNSAFEIIRDIIYAETLGIKTLYYMKSLKSQIDENKCESCVL